MALRSPAVIALALTAFSAAPAGALQSTEGPSQVTAETTARPAQAVASRVRDVLKQHESEAAWQELATALPDMALSGSADLESTFEAARIAEEMAVPSRSDPTDRRVVAGDAMGAVLATLRGIDPDRIGQLFALIFGLFALSMLLRTTRPRGTPRTGEAVPVRCREARTLAAGGVPAYEISRRTGLAREAVIVLLSRTAQ